MPNDQTALHAAIDDLIAPLDGTVRRLSAPDVAQAVEHTTLRRRAFPTSAANASDPRVKGISWELDVAELYGLPDMTADAMLRLRPVVRKD